MEEVSFPRGRPAQDIPEADKSDKPKRGRSSERSSTDKKRSTVDSADFLFGGGATEDKARSVSSKRKKAKTTEKASSSGASQSLLPLGGGGVVHPTNKEAWIEPLSFSKLAKGFKLLGCVRAVHDDLVIFSLPNMWTGYMLLDDSRKKNGPGHEWSCRQMVQPGQILSVIILKAVQEDNKSVAGNSGPRRRIQVTCVPAKMNPLEMSSSTMTSVRGQVISVEDHGLLVDLGMTRRGFLPFSEIDGEYTTEDDDKADNIADANKRLLRAGSIHDFTVRSGGGADAKIVPLSMSSKVRGAKQFLPSTHTPTLAALQPGTLVHAKVERVVRNGLCVSFGGDNGVFRGAIEVNHLGSLWVPENKHESIEWKTIFETNRSLTARIVAVDPITKIVRLSLMQHILDLKEPPALPAVGCIFEGATVIRLDPGVGALLALPDRLEEDAMPKRIHKLVSVEDAYGEATRVQAVYVHISKAIDERSGGKTPEATFSKEFAPSTKHSVRILSTSNWIDGIASGATSDSVISAHVLTHADLLPGKVYHNVPVCAQLNGGAILVDFGLGVRGLIPPLHLFDQAATSDFRTKMGKVKYAVGAKVDVRVLSVDVESKRCVVSAKKSLLKADDVILSYDNIKLGDKGTGFISKVDDRGLSVTFFGGVYGRVTARSLVAELGVEDHKENYNAGDVVQCRIVNIKKRKSRNLGQDDMDVDEADDSRAYWELTLSLGAHSDGDMQLEPDTLESSKSSQAVSLCAGAILPLKSLRIVELVAGREKEKGYVPGHAIVRIKSKYLVEVESEAMLPYIECKLPYDQLLDQYDDNDVESAASLDALADKLLTVGKKIDREGLVMTDPRKSRAEYSSATGKLTVVSIRPKLVNAAKVQLVIDEEKSSKELILPRPDTQLYMGAKLLGYVAQVDARFGAFVRFLDGMTGLVPKLKGGNDMKLFSTVETQIIALDVTTRPVKILLSLSRSKSKKKVVSEVEFEKVDIHVGDLIDEAQVNDLDFHRAKLQILDSKWAGSENIRARVHCTMAESKSAGKLAKTKSDAEKQTISVVHPFYKWKTGMKLSDLTVVAVDCRAGIYYIELTNRKTGATSTEASGTKSQPPPFFFASASKLVPSQKVSGIVSSADQRRGGLWINLSPGVSGFLPGLELSLDPKVLNNLEQAFPVGSRLECSVLDKMAWIKLTAKLYGTAKKDEKKKSDVPLLSLLHDGDDSTTSKPIRGDLVVGRISNSLQALHAPALMFELRGGYVGRCCITEVDEVDDWVNMPLGRVSAKKTKPSGDLDGMDVDASDGEDDEQDLEEIRYVLVKSADGHALHKRNGRFSLSIDCDVSRLAKVHILTETVGVERLTAISLVGRNELLSSIFI
jgi:ribosomal protein S1